MTSWVIPVAPTAPMARAAMSTVGMLFMIDDSTATVIPTPRAAVSTPWSAKNPNSLASWSVKPWLRRP